MPNFKHNLLSVSKVIDDLRLVATFDYNGCVLQDPITKACLADGAKAGGLYRLQVENSKVNTGATVAESKTYFTGHTITSSRGTIIKDVEDIYLVHARLGHASMSKMCHMDNITAKSSSDFVCKTYQMAKFHRLPFTQGDFIASSPFELIHMDLWGPYKTLDITGASYFLTAADDHTKFIWVYMI